MELKVETATRSLQAPHASELTGKRYLTGCGNCSYQWDIGLLLHNRDPLGCLLVPPYPVIKTSRML